MVPVMKWRIEIADQAAGSLKRYAKKHPEESLRMFANLQRFLDLVNEEDRDPRFVVDVVRQEKGGLLAADTRGMPRSSKRESRLYFYPIHGERVLRVLRVGDKDTQTRDIRECRDLIRKLE